MAEKLDATFFAFKKREGSLLLGASLTYVVLLILLFVVFGVLLFALLGPNFMQLAQMANEAQTDPEAMAGAISGGAIGGLILLYLAFLIVIFIVTAAFEAACLRWMIHGEKKGLFGFALDADTWRVYGIYWVWLIACILGAIVLALLMGILGGIAGAAAGDAAPFAVILVTVVLFIAPIYLGVRLAPAAATSVGLRKFAFFEAWNVTSGRFWALFGSFLLLWIIYMVVAIALSFGMYALLLGPNLGEVLSSASGGDPAGMSLQLNQALAETLTSPFGIGVYVGSQVLIGAVGIAFYVLLYGVNARAVRAALDEGKVQRA